MRPPKLILPPRGRVLVLAPHPDDEACGIGGTLALHRRQGDPVLVCFVTDGTNGDPDGRFGPGLAETRRKEALAAAEILGGLETRFLGLPDGREVNERDLDMVAGMLETVLASWRPDLVYLPWPEEAHADHAHVAAAAYRMLGRVRGPGEEGPRVLEFEVWSPLPAEFIVDITETAETKRRAMLAHASQVHYTDYPHQLMGLAAHRSVYLPKGSRYGEAFREGRFGGVG